MTQCKRSDCRKEAAKPGEIRGGPYKQYCPEHLRAYHQKRAEAERRKRLMPDCESGAAADCAGKVSLSRMEHGKTICAQCEAALEAHAAEGRKWRAFDEAATVEELKEWIRKHML